MHVVTTEQMRQLEQAAVDAGATWSDLMEQAGWGVAQEALRRLRDARMQQVLVLVGPGNNGGDGLVVARHLHDAGARVTLYIWKRSDAAHDANWQRCRQRDIAEVPAAEDQDQAELRRLLATASMVVDALLGMGVSRAVTGELAAIVETVNAAHAKDEIDASARTILSVDMPTGIHSDQGTVLDLAVWADATVATGLVKQGLLLYPGKRYAGEISVVDIGIPPGHLEEIMTTTITVKQAQGLLPARPEDSHKGTFGKAMIVAGSLQYPGAAVLATASAGRVGAGLVTLATGRGILGLIERTPEVTLLPLPEADLGLLGTAAAERLSKNLEGYKALLIGPGLGNEETTSKFVQRLFGIEQKKRARARVGFRPHATDSSEESSEIETTELPYMVIDADGLNILAEIEDWPEHLPKHTIILTPHPGEMRRLLKTDELENDLVQVATAAAERWQQVVVFKGATTVVAAPDGRSVVHALGNPALATAGTGDVLSGAIVGLLAQGMDLFDAAVLGVYLHGAAGQLVREEIGDAGALASDVIIRLPQAIKQLKK